MTSEADHMTIHCPRNLLPHEMGLFRDHLLRLCDADRNLRFAGRMSDDAVGRYVDGIDLRRSVIKVVFADDLSVAAAVHIALADDGKTAEIGLSVDAAHRGHGLGSRLLDAAVRHLRARGVDTVVMMCLRRNVMMMRIARREGMRIVFHGDDVEAVLPIRTSRQAIFWLDEFVSEWKGWTLYNHLTASRLFHNLSTSV